MTSRRRFNFVIKNTVTLRGGTTREIRGYSTTELSDMWFRDSSSLYTWFLYVRWFHRIKMNILFNQMNIEPVQSWNSSEDDSEYWICQNHCFSLWNCILSIIYRLDCELVWKCFKIMIIAIRFTRNLNGSWKIWNAYRRRRFGIVQKRRPSRVGGQIFSHNFLTRLVETGDSLSLLIPSDVQSYTHIDQEKQSEKDTAMKTI